MKSLTEDEINSLMSSDAYQNKSHPQYKETQEKVSKAWEKLYPDDDRNENPDNYYVWRTVGDGSVRSSHADLDGEVFCWDNPPECGHPGEDYGCRCEAELYEVPKEMDPSIVDKLGYASAGAMQGLSLGWADEIEGIVGGAGYAIASMNPKWNNNNETPKEAYNRGYVKHRDKRREHVKEGYDKAPMITGIGEVIGAIASPIKFTKVAKTAPLGVKARQNIVEGVASGTVYGAGVSEGGAGNYAGNIIASIAGNLTGNVISNKTFGRAGAPIARKAMGETVNTGFNKTKNILEEKSIKRKKTISK